MAGGNLSPRQKMINLMYLIFIAMLALNMSKEVLSAFGLMNERITDSNIAATERNEGFFAGLEQQAQEQSEKYGPLLEKATNVKSLAADLNGYIESLKGQMTSTVEDPENYEIMDKGDFLDNYFFKGDKLKDEGQEFLDKIAAFRTGVVGVIGEDKGYTSIADDVKEKFATEPVKVDGEVKPKSWLEYHYRGFPLVASLTKMTQLQADIKNTESEVMSRMLEGQLKVEASLTNFDAIVLPEKTAFFNGEAFKGKIVLGKTDRTLKADKVVINGKELPLDAMENGQINLNFPAGAVGERDIKGEIYFTEGGESFAIPVSSKYAVVPKPNSATISADKMNVVYRGVDNPMTISFAGVSSNSVVANAPGLTKTGNGKYMMRPTTGKTVTINVSGTLSDGSKVSDKATFRIKDIPKPTGTIAGQDGSVKLPRNNVEIGTVGAKLFDFDFDLPLKVKAFKFKVPGQPTVSVNGSKLNAQSKAALRKARRGDGVQIFDIKVKATGSSVIVKPASPVFVELAN
ncbi:MAG: gliding motility protein GldM [Flavobacteriaceae bacterium]|nr:gliding motility protein GldM [Flavobacteriaceae bacterium]